MPEASQHVEQAKLVLHVGGGGAFNTAYLFFFVGYVAILICEKVLTIDDAESGGGSGNNSEAFFLSCKVIFFHTPMGRVTSSERIVILLRDR